MLVAYYRFLIWFFAHMPRRPRHWFFDRCWERAANSHGQVEILDTMVLEFLFPE